MITLIRLRTATPVFGIAFVLAWFALSPVVQAVVPPPDGGYPGANTAEGTNALLSVTTGVFNTALGWLTLQSNTQAKYNTAVGAGALFSNTITEQNTATGAGALFNNIGAHNTANGAFALFINTAGSGNTAIGSNALYSNTTASDNTATGFRALLNNTNGPDNTGTGAEALMFNSTGQANTATGASALHNNSTGSFNTANGAFSIVNHTVGDKNSALGEGTLFDNQSGTSNTAIGQRALAGLVTGDNNTALGEGAGSNQTGGVNNVYIGQGILGVAGENNACYIKSIFGQMSGDGVAVFVNPQNKLGTNPSSQRFKKEIKPMDHASEAILALKPVTFHYKADTFNRPQFGLVAEEVEKINPDLVVRDTNGEIYSVRYDAVNVMLLNEFLKARRQIDAQQKQIDALTAGLQKVSTQLELSKPAPQTVTNND
jgi:Chaperone of endosialidase